MTTYLAWPSRPIHLLEKLKLNKDSKSKSQSNLSSHLGISVGDVGNILKMMREYENLGEPLG